jgi:hypothetical protein
MVVVSFTKRTLTEEMAFVDGVEGVLFGCFAISGSSDVRWWLALAGANSIRGCGQGSEAREWHVDPVVVAPWMMASAGFLKRNMGQLKASPCIYFWEVAHVIGSLFRQIAGHQGAVMAV